MAGQIGRRWGRAVLAAVAVGVTVAGGTAVAARPKGGQRGSGGTNSPSTPSTPMAPTTPTPSAAKPAATDETTESLGGSPLTPPSKDAHVDYDMSLDGEQAIVRMPKSVKADATLGVLVYVGPAAEPSHVPAGWASVLDGKKLIYVSPSGVSGEEPTKKACGLAVFAALRMAAAHKVDPARVYVAGTAGGARVAGELGFYQSDVFHGTVQCGGADYPTAVPKSAARDPKAADDAEYGKLAATDDEVSAARANVRFALVTGSKDPRRPFILDLFHGGFEKDGYQAKLFDGSGGDKGPAIGQRFGDAMSFVDKRPAPGGTSRPTAPPADAAPTAAAAASPADNEAAANSQLDLADNYIAAKHYESAGYKLRAIMTKYPDTAAAKKAADLLKTLPAE